jgi:hypothetical protein
VIDEHSQKTPSIDFVSCGVRLPEIVEKRQAEAENHRP